MELRYGSRRRQDHASFWRRIETELLSRVVILPIAQHTVLIAGDLASALSLRGTVISPEDLLIAASALQTGMTVITGNTRHFQKIPNLKLENWLQ